MLRDNTLRVLQLISHDKQFEYNANQSGVIPNILNKIDLSEPNYTERLAEHIFSSGSGADFIARCQCGETEGNSKIGMICPVCQTVVSSSHLLDDKNLVCKNWVSCPKELEHGWLAPKIYLTLANWLSYDKGKRNYLDDILDVTTPIPFELMGVVQDKGFTYLYENFDRIIDFFVYDHPVISKKADTPSMRLCLTLNRDRLFCHYIPILNAAITPIVSLDNSGSNKKRFSDVTADHIMRAAITLSRLEFTSRKRLRRDQVERTAFKAFKDIIAYVEEATRKYVSTKKAIPRTHVFGSRMHYSFRAVVTPIIGPHVYDELHIPYSLAVNTLRVHLVGYLCRDYKLSLSDAVSKVRAGLQVLDPDLKMLMDRMIYESPFKGLACVWDRPPSIRDGSVMLKFWTKIKSDLNDSCISMTPIDVALPNADFDGDYTYC